jgi:hypothetical protein
MMRRTAERIPGGGVVRDARRGLARGALVIDHTCLAIAIAIAGTGETQRRMWLVLDQLGGGGVFGDSLQGTKYSFVHEIKCASMCHRNSGLLDNCEIFLSPTRLLAFLD